MADFPSTIACISANNLSETIPKKKKYLGIDKFSEYLPIVNVTAVIRTHADMILFKDWYMINRNIPFNITLPLFGETKVYSVGFASPMTFALTMVESRKAPMKLVVYTSL